ARPAEGRARPDPDRRQGQGQNGHAGHAAAALRRAPETRSEGRGAGSQRMASLTRAPMRCSSAAVRRVNANEVGHIAPSSRFASSLKPNVEYLDLNLCALWKKQRTLPSLAYAGIPYHVLGASSGALALTRAWSRSAIERSGSGISAIFASTSRSPSSLPARGPRRAAVLSSW